MSAEAVGAAAGVADLIDDMVDRVGGDVASLWPQVAELELDRAGIGEHFGGAGGSFVDQVNIVRAFGRRGVSLPIIESLVARHVLAQCQRDAGDELTVVTLGDVAVDGSRLSGVLEAVPWARQASALIVCPHGSAPLYVSLATADVTYGENVASEPRDRVTLTNVEYEALEAADYTEVRSLLAVLWSAATVGACEGAFAWTRRYVSEREQFGKPLREIPAVGRGLALMRVALIQARAALDFAVQRRDGSGEQVGSLIARVTAAAVATDIATRAHQLHGAIGVTMEYRLHEYTTRLWAWRDAVADEAEWTRELGTLSLAAGESTVWNRFTNPAEIAWLPNIETRVPAAAEQ